MWQFKSLIWGTSSRFPLASHFDFPGSESLFGLSQDPPMVVYASLSQGGFQQRGLWVALASLLISNSKEFSSQEGLLISENEKYEVSCLLSGKVPASSLSCPAFSSWNISIHRQGTNSRYFPRECEGPSISCQ